MFYLCICFLFYFHLYRDRLPSSLGIMVTDLRCTDIAQNCEIATLKMEPMSSQATLIHENSLQFTQHIFVASVYAILHQLKKG